MRRFDRQHEAGTHHSTLPHIQFAQALHHREAMSNVAQMLRIRTKPANRPIRRQQRWRGFRHTDNMMAMLLKKLNQQAKKRVIALEGRGGHTRHQQRPFRIQLHRADARPVHLPRQQHVVAVMFAEGPDNLSRLTDRGPFMRERIHPIACKPGQCQHENAAAAVARGNGNSARQIPATGNNTKRANHRFPPADCGETASRSAASHRQE